MPTLAPSSKHKVDWNAVYKLLDEGLWWSLPEGKLLAIVSNHADKVAARQKDESFVRANGGSFVRWSIEAHVVGPDNSIFKRDHWPRMRAELYRHRLGLLLCSAESLSSERPDSGGGEQLM